MVKQVVDTGVIVDDPGLQWVYIVVITLSLQLAADQYHRVVIVDVGCRVHVVDARWRLINACWHGTLMWPSFAQMGHRGHGWCASSGSR